MNALNIETKNGIHYCVHVTDSDLEEFDSGVLYFDQDYVKVKCAESNRTVVFKRSELSSYSYGKVGEASQ